LPLPAGCTNGQYLTALDAALERIAEHDAAVLVVSLGFDTYGQNPIADFALSTDAYHEVGRRVAGLGLPTLILQEGRYFVPKLGENARTWLRGLLGRPLDLRATPG
jgi:acetoin utilization deacetylase AcuC-like enzyme